MSENKVYGIRHLRNNLSQVMENVISNYKVMECGNIKRNKAEKVTLISSSLLDDILKIYKFNPVVNFDKETNQYEVILNEINVYGFGDSKNAAFMMVLDLVKDCADEYFVNIEIYARIPEYRAKYPYYLQIQRCTNDNELKETLSLCDI